MRGEGHGPQGWDQARVREVIEYYEHQTDEEAAAEHEAALSRPGERATHLPERWHRV